MKCTRNRHSNTRKSDDFLFFFCLSTSNDLVQTSKTRCEMRLRSFKTHLPLVKSKIQLLDTVNLGYKETPLGQAFWCPYKRGSLSETSDNRELWQGHALGCSYKRLLLYRRSLYPTFGYTLSVWERCIMEKRKLNTLHSHTRQNKTSSN
jgi:hypothetical protein